MFKCIEKTSFLIANANILNKIKINVTWNCFTYPICCANNPWISATVVKYDTNGDTCMTLELKSQFHKENIIFWSTEVLITKFLNTLIPKIIKRLK